MPRTLPTGLQAELNKQSGCARVHLIDVQRADGSLYYWSSHAGSYPARLGGGTPTYNPWIKKAPTIKLSRSLQADGGDFSLQNLSGNTIQRDVATLYKNYEFQGAYVVYRPWFPLIAAAAFEFHGRLTEADASDEELGFRVLQLFAPSQAAAQEFLQSRHCNFRYRSAQCGMRRGTLFVPTTTADVHTSTTIGNTGLTLTPSLYNGELVMILSGTGSGQEKTIVSHSATTFTTAAWGVTPDGTSKFIVTGPGTMKVSPQLADTWGPANIIGRSTLARTVNQDQFDLLVIVDGTGAGQERQIASNTATTYTLTSPLTVMPDGTSRFIVIYRICPKDRPSCVLRGTIERFSGIIYLSPDVTNLIKTGLTPTPIGSGGGGTIFGPRFGPNRP